MQKDLGLLALRFSGGFLMLYLHGWSKLMNYSTLKETFPDPIGLGSQLSLMGTIFTEVFCAFFVLLGIATRWASIPLAFTMLVAAFVVKAGKPLADMELALVFLSIYAALIALGGGRFGLDPIVKKLKN